MSRRGTSSGGGASSLGYLFGSDVTALARPNNRAPPRHQQPPETSSPTQNPMVQQQYSGYNPSRSRQQQYEQDWDPPTSGYGTPTSGYETPTGYDTPSGRSSDYGLPSSAMLESNSRPPPIHHQTRAAGKVINDGGSVSLDMSGGSIKHINYFQVDGQKYGNFITDRPSIRVHAAPGGDSSLGYLFGGA